MSKIDNPKTWVSRFKVFIKTIIQQELTGASGVEKRRIAIMIINEVVDIPFIPHVVEGKLIGWFIDGFVFLLNWILGKQWINKIPPVETLDN